MPASRRSHRQKKPRLPPDEVVLREGTIALVSAVLACGIHISYMCIPLLIFKAPALVFGLFTILDCTFGAARTQWTGRTTAGLLVGCTAILLTFASGAPDWLEHERAELEMHERYRVPVE